MCRGCFLYPGCLIACEELCHGPTSITTAFSDYAKLAVHSPNVANSTKVSSYTVLQCKLKTYLSEDILMPILIHMLLIHLWCGWRFQERHFYKIYYYNIFDKHICEVRRQLGNVSKKWYFEKIRYQIELFRLFYCVDC